MMQEIIRFYKSYRLYIFPIIVGISSMILIIFIIFPQTSKLIANQQIEGEILNKSQFLVSKVQALENYDNSDLSHKVDSALGYYPTDKEVISAVGLLQNLTQSSGFSITSISLGGGLVKLEHNAQSYSIKLEISGPSQLLATLLSAIESSKRLMRVESVELISGRDAAISDASLIVDVLYASPPTELGSVDSPLPELSQKDQAIIARLSTLIPPVTQKTPINIGPRGKSNIFE